MAELRLENDHYSLYLFILKDWWQDTDIVESLRSLPTSLNYVSLQNPLPIIMFDENVKGRTEKPVIE